MMRLKIFNLALLLSFISSSNSYAALVSDHSVIGATEDSLRKCNKILEKSQNAFVEMVKQSKCALIVEGSEYEMVKRGRFISKIKVQGSIVYARTSTCCQN